MKFHIIANFILNNNHIKIMSIKNVIPTKIPPKIYNKKNYSDIILYALSNFGPLRRAEFDSLNKTTFYKYFNKLVEKEFVVTNRENKYAFYNITSLGEKELSRRLIQYELDIETLLNIEERKSKRLISELEPFLNKFGMKDEELIIEYIEISKVISLEKFKPLFSREKLNILTLFLALNHPKFYNYYSISTEGFLREYNINLKDKITSAELMIFLERVMMNNMHDIRFYEFDLVNKGIKLYFRENCVSGKIFDIIVNSELNHFNYLSNLNKIEKNRENLDNYYSEINSILINDFNLFHPDFEESLGNLIDNYIKNIRLELEQKAKTRFSSNLLFWSLPLRKRLPKITLNSLGISNSSFNEYLKKWKETYLGSENEFLKNAEEFYNNDQFDKALEEINKAIEFKPNVPEFYQRKAAILSDLEKYDEALSTIEKGIDIDPNGYLDILYKDKTEILFKMGLIDSALGAINKSIELTEGWDTPYWVKAKILFEKGLYSDALKAINFGIDLNPERGESYHIKAQILYVLERFTDALETINMAIEYDSNFSSFYNFKAIILLELDKLNDALKTVDMGLDLDPNFIEFYNTKGEILCELRKLDEALKTVERGLNLDPNYIESYATKGLILREMQKFDEALKIVEEGIKLNPSFLNFYDLKSMILTDMNKVQEALSVIETGIKLDPEYPLFYQLKAIILTELSQCEKALLAINKAIELNPNFSGYYHTKADVLYSFKHHDNAIKVIEKAINLEPKEELYYYLYGKILMEKIMYKEAIKKFEKSVKLQPDGLMTHEPLINMGICYKELGQYKIALEKLEKGKKIAKKFNADESLETADKHILEIREKLI